ncbi:hypothetical protein M0534_01890 [Methylonatrum kenyense]|uniref:hypothetical protein n=1 Tax=Methylonatrum kenyense TaxID=455253 RepID=UPI0020BEBABE|nr:hypothetical protein [Methylonatrum kenyense]MCK8515084.1 hypothetical protein [Methylonatrum kenyense]
MKATDPIEHDGVQTLSFRQIDGLNGFAKGTAFRLFKRCRAELREGQDYFYLPAASHPALIESLKTDGRIYRGTTHLVLVTRSGYERMQRLTVRES